MFINAKLVFSILFTHIILQAKDILSILFFICYLQLTDAREHITDLTNANNLLGIDKRRLEGDLRGAQQELDNLVNAVKHAEEKARKAISDAGI